jgi:NTE family protein
MVLSGGGIRGLSYAGCFIELETLGHLKYVNEFLVVSCGAIISFAYIIGYTPSEILLLTKNLNFSLIQNLDADIAFDYLDNYGLDDGANLERFLECLLRNKGYTKDLTYLQLYDKTKIHFRTFAVELNTCKLKEFSYKLTPDENIIFGIKATTCIPGYFIPLKKNDMLYVDGGLLNNYPINLIPFEEQIYTIGFAFYNDKIVKNKIDNFIEFINQMFTCANTEKENIKRKYSSNTILIHCGDYPLWNFSASEEDRNYLIECGKTAVIDFYKKFKLNKPLRRNSVA